MYVRTLLLAAVGLFALFLLSPTSPARADDHAEKERLARELMELTGSADLGQQMMEGMLAQFRQTPGVSEEFIDVFLEVVPGLRLFPSTDPDLDLGLGVRYFF